MSSIPKHVADQLTEIAEYRVETNPDIDDPPLTEYAYNYTTVLMHSLYQKNPDLPIVQLGVNLQGGVDIYWTGKVFLTIPPIAGERIRDFLCKTEFTDLDSILDHVLKQFSS